MDEFPNGNLPNSNKATPRINYSNVQPLSSSFALNNSTVMPKNTPPKLHRTGDPKIIYHVTPTQRWFHGTLQIFNTKKRKWKSRRTQKNKPYERKQFPSNTRKVTLFNRSHQTNNKKPVTLSPQKAGARKRSKN